MRTVVPLLTLCLLAGPAIAQDKAAEPLPEALTKEWEKAQFRFGWAGINPRDNQMYFSHFPDQIAAGTHLPGFNYYGYWKAGVVPKLPAPDRPFGLAISSGDVGRAGLKELAALKNLVHLTLLSDPALTDADFKTLGGMEQLTSLRLITVKVSPAGLKEIARNKNLRALSLRLGRLNDAALEELLPLTNLERLEIGGNSDITDAGIKTIAKLKQLRHLDLASTKVTDAGLKDLATLENLETLDLVSLQLTDEGVAQLTPLKKLRGLSLARHGLSNLSEGVLKTVVQFKELRQLQLHGVGVTDAGLKQLAGLPLTHLHLYGNPLTDACIPTLATFKDLQWVELRETKVTRHGAEELKKSLPKCTVWTQ